MISPEAKNILYTLQTAEEDPENVDVVVTLTDLQHPFQATYGKSPKAYLDMLVEAFKDRPEVVPNSLFENGLDIQVAPGVRLFLSMAEVPRLIEVLTAAMGDVFLYTLTAKSTLAKLKEEAAK